MAGPLVAATVNLTSAGTPQRITTGEEKASTVILRSKTGNVGSLYIGDSAVTTATGAILQGEGLTINKGEAFSLSDIYFDGGTSNDDLDYWYIPA
jgi:hypothetical protein